MCAALLQCHVVLSLQGGRAGLNSCNACGAEVADAHVTLAGVSSSPTWLVNLYLQSTCKYFETVSATLVLTNHLLCSQQCSNFFSASLLVAIVQELHWFDRL